MSLEITYVHEQKLTVDSDWYSRYSRYKIDLNLNASNQDKQAEILNDYLDDAKNHEKNHPDSAPVRSAFYSSILEEHPVLVFENYIREKTANRKYNFHLGNKECTIFAGASVGCKKRFESKKIDFAFCVQDDDFPHPILLVGFEVKKYLDKTMYDSVIHTHESLRKLRADTVYGFIGEDEARGKDVIANSMMRGKEFILTGKERKGGDRHKIDADIYSAWYLFTKKSIDDALNILP